MSATPHPEHPDARWVKSSHSNGSGGECVEVAAIGGGRTAVRDSKDPTGHVLQFGPGAWNAFLGAVKGCDFDR